MQKQSTQDKQDQSYQLVSSVERIQALLRPIIEKHNFATITIAGHEDEYSSMLLKSDPDLGELVIDGLHPDDGNTHFVTTRELSLDTQLDGIHLQFDTELRESFEENGVIYHIVTYPENIRYWQRRQAFRASVTPAYNISVVLKTDDGNQCRGELFNISIGGICIRFPGKKSLPEEFTKSTVICSLNLPENNHLKCELKLTHTWHNIPSNSLHVGAQFLKLDKVQNRAVQRFVTDLQRQQRQNAGG